MLVLYVLQLIAGRLSCHQQLSTSTYIRPVTETWSNDQSAPVVYRRLMKRCTVLDYQAEMSSLKTLAGRTPNTDHPWQGCCSGLRCVTSKKLLLQNDVGSSPRLKARSRPHTFVRHNPFQSASYDRSFKAAMYRSYRRRSTFAPPLYFPAPRNGGPKDNAYP